MSERRKVVTIPGGPIIAQVKAAGRPGPMRTIEIQGGELSAPGFPAECIACEFCRPKVLSGYAEADALYCVGRLPGEIPKGDAPPDWCSRDDERGGGRE